MSLIVARKGGDLQFHALEYRVRVYRQNLNEFRSVRNSHVLIYFPHGFGDYVQLSYVLSLLDRSNRYWIFQFGDDNSSLFSGHEIITPLFVGINSTRMDFGAPYGLKHFGINYDDADGREQILRLPLNLHDECSKAKIDVVLWVSFAETHGGSPYPLHTKARRFIDNVRSNDAVVRSTLERPLAPNVDFAMNANIVRYVESRLRSLCGYRGKKLCLISRNGYTSLGKNWGHEWRDELPIGRRVEGTECRDFMSLMRRKDNNWLFLVMENQLFKGYDTVRSREYNAYSYAELFGESETNNLPFGWIARVLVSIADLSVGVPTGAYHLSMARRDLPTVGIWLQHMPNWYEEPRSGAVHILGKSLVNEQLDQQVGSFLECGCLRFAAIQSATKNVSGEQVFHAVETLI